MTTATRTAPDPAALAEEVLAAARNAGLDRLGVCSADPFDDVRTEMERRRRQGLSSRLTFTYLHPERSTSPRASFPWARRLVVGAMAYLPDAGHPGPGAAGSGRIGRFAVSDYYRDLRAGLQAVAATLVQAGHRAEILADDNRLVDRAAAVRAGVGWWGKNAMVLVPGLGPWVLLGSVVTDAELPVTGPMRRGCGTCRACLPACPTGALIAPGVLDANRCLAAVLQLPGPIPSELREAVGDRLYGCDDCLEACPPGRRLLSRSRDRRGRVDLVGLLRSSDEELMRRFGRFYIPRRDPDVLRRNALVALGNTGTTSHVPLLIGYLEHPNPLLRRHAAWALGRIGGVRAAAALSETVRRDPSPEVRGEAREALARLHTCREPSAKGK